VLFGHATVRVHSLFLFPAVLFFLPPDYRYCFRFRVCTPPAGTSHLNIAATLVAKINDFKIEIIKEEKVVFSLAPHERLIEFPP